MDCYIFLTLHTNKKLYLDYLNATCQGQTLRGARWFTPQFMADTGVYASLPRAAMRFQVWTAVAYNIKGFFPWYYEPAKRPDLTDRDFSVMMPTMGGREGGREALDRHGTQRRLAVTTADS